MVSNSVPDKWFNVSNLFSSIAIPLCSPLPTFSMTNLKQDTRDLWWKATSQTRKSSLVPQGPLNRLLCTVLKYDLFFPVCTHLLCNTPLMRSLRTKNEMKWKKKHHFTFTDSYRLHLPQVCHFGCCLQKGHCQFLDVLNVCPHNFYSWAVGTVIGFIKEHDFGFAMANLNMHT